MKEICMKMVNTTYSTTDDMINKIQQLKGKTKLIFFKNITKFYDEMKHKIFPTQKDFFKKYAQGISKIHHEVLLLINFFQAKPHVMKKNFK